MSLNEFSIAESDAFQAKLNSRDFKHLGKKINEYVYPILKRNPFFGPIIKKLKGDFEGIYRYRIGKFWLFYIIEETKLIVVFIEIDKRKDAYE